MVRSLALGTNQPGMHQYFQVGRRGALDGADTRADLARRNAFGTCLHEQPEDIETGILAKGSQGRSVKTLLT